ncbi:MAG: dienelactone hydrolase family protein [Proteobacteria bacterium]|nr:dienelactone hydrolase family protein [Pseudomonadota bacterium]
MRGAHAITQNELGLDVRDGRTFAGYYAAPVGARGPGVLLLTEMFGVTGPMRAAADDFARAGFPTLVPNLFWRAPLPGVLAYEGPERAQAFERLRGFDHATAIDDMRRGAAVLRAQAACAEPHAAIGFCMGGRLAVLAALEIGVDAAVSYYGLGISTDGARLAGLGCPVQLHYGLADEHVPPAEVAAVARAAAGNPRIEIFRYPDAGHSFCNPVRPTYDPAAAALAFERARTLLDRLGQR